MALALAGLTSCCAGRRALGLPAAAGRPRAARRAGSALGSDGLLPFRVTRDRFSARRSSASLMLAIATLGVRLEPARLRRRARQHRHRGRCCSACRSSSAAAWARWDYTRTRDVHAQRIIEALARYYETRRRPIPTTSRSWSKADSSTPCRGPRSASPLASRRRADLHLSGLRDQLPARVLGAALGPVRLQPALPRRGDRGRGRGDPSDARRAARTTGSAAAPGRVRRSHRSSGRTPCRSSHRSSAAQQRIERARRIGVAVGRVYLGLKTNQVLARGLSREQMQRALEPLPPRERRDGLRRRRRTARADPEGLPVPRRARRPDAAPSGSTCSNACRTACRRATSRRAARRRNRARSPARRRLPTLRAAPDRVGLARAGARGGAARRPPRRGEGAVPRDRRAGAHATSRTCAPCSARSTGSRATST